LPKCWSGASTGWRWHPQSPSQLLGRGLASILPTPTASVRSLVGSHIWAANWSLIIRGGIRMRTWGVYTARQPMLWGFYFVVAAADMKDE
jgi:hypothetical protein